MRASAGVVLKIVVVVLLGAAALGLGVVTSAPASATWAEPTFSDVSGSTPFHEEIRWMAITGIATTTTPPSAYNPGSNVTRQAMAAFLYRLAGEPAFSPPGSPTFSDVGSGHSFYAEIEWMAAEGISTGSTFSPSTAVSRQAMAAFLYRLAGEPAFSPPGSPTFSDVGTGHSFYAEIEWMAAEGISTGSLPGPTYGPSTSATRQAMAAFLYRFWQGPGVATAISTSGPGTAVPLVPAATYDEGEVVYVEHGSGMGDLHVALEDDTSATAFTSGFGAAIRERNARPISVLALGDSLTEGAASTTIADPWPTRLQSLLRTRWQTVENGADGGFGYLPSHFQTSSLPDPTVTGNVVLDNWDVGLGFRGFDLRAASSPTPRGSVSYSVTGTTARIWYATSSTAAFDTNASMEVVVDGGAPTSISLPVATQRVERYLDVGLGAAGSHTVVVRHASGGDAMFGGLQVFAGDEDSGIQVLNAGRHGWSASFFANPSSEYLRMVRQQVALLEPDLVTVMLGVNDMLNPGTKPGGMSDEDWHALLLANFNTAMTNLVEAIQEGDASTSILLLGTWERTPGTPPPVVAWPQYLEEVEDVASDTGTSYFDISEVWDTVGTNPSQPYFSDAVHLNSAGNVALAQLLSDELTATPGWDLVGSRP